MNDVVERVAREWERDSRTLTVGEAVSAIAGYCRAMRDHNREPKFSDLPRVLGLRAAACAAALADASPDIGKEGIGNDDR